MVGEEERGGEEDELDDGEGVPVVDGAIAGTHGGYR